MLTKARTAILYVAVGLAFVTAGLPGAAEPGNGAASSPVPYSVFRGGTILLAAKNPKCAACDRALDRCNQNPPYGNERICASNYYDCIKNAHVKCD